MKPLPRTAGSSFDEALFNEVQGAITRLRGEEEIEADQLGLIAESDDESNYLRGQEMALVIASPGWGYIKESLGKMVLETETSFKAAVTDEEILRKQREWKAMQNAVERIIANVEIAAQVKHPNAIV